MAIQLDPSQWRLSTLGNIPVKVISRSGMFEKEEASATEVYLIKAYHLDDFVNEVFPVVYDWMGIAYYPRARAFPGLGTLSAKRITWEAWTDGKPVDPFNTDASAPADTYEEDLKVTIEYGTTPNNDDEADPTDPFTFLEISCSGGGDFQPLDVNGQGRWKPATGDTPLEEVKEPDIYGVVNQPQVEWHVRWPQLPWATFNGTILGRLRDKLGKVNSTAMTLLFNAPAETVLFTSWSMSQQYTWRSGFTGASPLNLDLNFVERNFTAPDGVQVTHNHIYRKGVGFRRLLVDGTNPIYSLANLDSIFAPNT